MRFMVLVKANSDSEAGKLPDEQLMVAMGKFNEELIKGGVLLAGDGLHASSKGARIQLSATGPAIVTDGPFTETKELISGFWMVQVKSKAEAIEWFKRCPADVGEIEVRQVFDAEDFAPVISTEEGRATLAADEEFRRQSKT